MMVMVTGALRGPLQASMVTWRHAQKDTATWDSYKKELLRLGVHPLGPAAIMGDLGALNQSDFSTYAAYLAEFRRLMAAVPLPMEPWTAAAIYRIFINHVDKHIKEAIVAQITVSPPAEGALLETVFQLGHNVTGHSSTTLSAMRTPIERVERVFRCFNCKEEGHIARHCRRRAPDPTSTGGNKRSRYWLST